MPEIFHLEESNRVKQEIKRSNVSILETHQMYDGNYVLICAKTRQEKDLKILLDIIIATSDGLRNPSPRCWYTVVFFLCSLSHESPCTDKSSFVKAFIIDA